MIARRLFPTCLFVFLSLPTFVQAEPGSPDYSSVEIGTKAQAIKKTLPEYPWTERRRGREGYVELSYVVSPEGAVSNVVINDVIGPEIFGREAKRAVETWTFTPATWQGKPVEQCSNEVAVSFILSPVARGATPAHMQKYKDIGALIDQGNFVEAESALNGVFDEDLNQYERGFFNLLHARLANAQNHPNKERYYLKRAAIGEKIIGHRADRAILQKLFIAEVNSGNLADAMATYERLKRHSRNIGDWQEYEKRYQQILTARNGDGLLVTAGEIKNYGDERNSLWQHGLLRRSVEFTEINGQLDKFELRCERKYFTDKVASDKNWAVPENWGACSVYVYGEPNATFKLVELPSAPPQPAGSDSSS